MYLCLCCTVRYQYQNYAHQTPLGVAKFSRSKACQLFLQSHYKRVDVTGGRNAVGDIWWDKDIDEVGCTFPSHSFFCGADNE